MATSTLPRMLTKALLDRKLLALTSLSPSVRHLNLLEYQSKDLLDKHGVTVQKFKMAESAEQAKEAVKTFVPAEYVVKAQILAGGRGKGTFDNGFKGGVHLTKDASNVPMLVSSMAGHRLRTKQTPKSGILVRKVMIAESVDILRETYFCILMDREYNGPVIIASPDGGVDIEEVAEKTPDRLRTLPVDIHQGVTDQMASELAAFLDFKGDLQAKAAGEIQALWKLFLAVDATQVEINPFIETPQGQVVAVDAKIQFDDNAEFRQREIFAQEDTSESDPREVEAANHNLNYIGMDGNIGCLVNGAGLAMATMDIIKLHGGEPANFLDCGGGVQEEQVKNAFQLLTSDPNVKAILVNVFGGIVNCATIANGIVNASKSISLDLPLVVRLEGTNVEEARRILSDSRLPIQTASDLEDAAKKAVASL
ncbi:succinate--CoA ligase [GDP-forming] subunit beta, mitochondrial-like [Pollicipes pollicipes]|uniref:succinate--CoA ligase [GDP-forming] subunit beta, mitochondrial-like n=1 Tax=Pollicipes pollicipes TaxID=41117 RepID=UPI0018854854|nr:succinate--CoA ligase [GDP-forming] subunit beta, mitochondrial-like [Pollicipes pollicipes]